MNARVSQISLGAILLLAPAAVFAAEFFHTAQFTTANGYTPNLTLLTGPNLLSPAPHGTLSQSSNGTVTVTSGSGLLTLGTPTFSFVRGEDSSPVAAPTNAEIENARQKLELAQARLRKLEAERAAALARERSAPRLFLKPTPVPALSADPIRFDAALPDVPTSLLRKPQAVPQGDLHFTPSAPGRD